ncbi:MAG: DUF2125 domain-containing protein [Beijerinckiaceae bacterium]|nr:DUF2125 domain-containing protein [Beijerinckiaceae bacterium]
MRKWATVSVSSVALSAIAWTGAWFFIAQKSAAALDKWIEDEKSRDRFWTCASRRTEGFPFQLQLRCHKPSFTSPTGPVQSGVAQRLMAKIDVTSPFQMGFQIEGPLELITRSGAASIRWDSFIGSIRTRTATPDISVSAQGVLVNEVSADLSSWARARASEVAIRVQPSPDRAPGSDAQLLTTSLDGMSAAPLDAFFGSADPFRTTLSAIILNAGSASSGSFSERLDRWSESGGRVQIGSLTAEKGASRLDASGDLALDDRRRPLGKLSVRVTGVQPILARLNLPSAPLAIEGLLRGSGNRGGASLLENRTLPLELRAGRLYIGPLRTPIVIPPLI